jgi:hypothetical protein
MPNQQDGENNVSVSDVSDVRSERGRPKRPQIPVPIWLSQLAYSERKTPLQVQRELVAGGEFSAESVGLY